MKTTFYNKGFVWSLVFVLSLFSMYPVQNDTGIKEIGSNAWSGIKKVRSKIGSGVKTAEKYVAVGLVLAVEGGRMLMAHDAPQVLPARTIEYEDGGDEYRMEIYDHGDERGKIKYYKKEHGYWREDGRERWY